MRASVRRVVIWSGIAMGLVALLVFAFMPRPVPVEVTEASEGSLVVTVDEQGRTRVRDRFVISAPVDGQVLRIEHEPGDAVRAGETVLATFVPSDPVPLDVRSRKEAEARVRAARAALDRARAERRRAVAEAEFAGREEERFRRLAADGVVSTEALDRAELEARTTRQALESAEFTLRTVRYELERAEALLVSSADGDDDTVISLRSPVDGVILQRFRESSAVVAAGEPLLEVADPGRLEIVADYLSSDAVRIRPGQRAIVERFGGPEELTARVRRVEPAGFTKISALGVEEQRVNVILDFEEPGQAASMLGDAYRVEVRVVVWEGEDVLQVPSGALFRRGEAWAVFTVDGGEAVQTPVEVGHRSERAVEIRSGLAAGQRVIVHPPEDVEEGVSVTRRAP